MLNAKKKTLKKIKLELHAMESIKASPNGNHLGGNQCELGHDYLIVKGFIAPKEEIVKFFN